MGYYAREPYDDPDFDVDIHMAKARNYEKKLAGGEMSETKSTKTMNDLLATLVCCVEEDLANGLDIRSERTRAAWDAIDAAHAATEAERDALREWKAGREGELERGVRLIRDNSLGFDFARDIAERLLARSAAGATTEHDGEEGERG